MYNCIQSEKIKKTAQRNALCAIRHGIDAV